MGGEALGLSSYPTFNSPDEIGDTLKDVGVDVVTMANNHTLDQGAAGVKHATAQYEKIGMAYTGAYANKVDSEKLTIEKTAEGISAAFLSYTYGTNGIPVPKGEDHLVNLIDKQQIKKISKKQNRKRMLSSSACILELNTRMIPAMNKESWLNTLLTKERQRYWAVIRMCCSRLIG